MLKGEGCWTANHREATEAAKVKEDGEGKENHLVEVAQWVKVLAIESADRVPSLGPTG